MSTSNAAALSAKRRNLGSRRLIVVDIENVVGGALRTADEVLWAKAQLEGVIETDPGDHIVVGTSHIGLLPVGCAWTHLRYVVRSGPDGADLALIDVLGENVPGRFDKVVLVSGDGIFTDSVTYLTTNGVDVTVVAHTDGLSRRLRMAATRVLYLAGHLQQPPHGDVA